MDTSTEQASYDRAPADKQDRSSFQRTSVQWKKKRPPKRNYHIMTLDNKPVCCVPFGDFPERRRSTLAKLEPIKPITTVKYTYKPHVQHPNLAKSPPTRYSANKNKGSPAMGIVPMPPLWMEMTEKLKAEDTHKRHRRRKSRKSTGTPAGLLPAAVNSETGSTTHRGSTQKTTAPRGSMQRPSLLPKVDLTDKTELFKMYSPPGPKWKSHWVGPM